jgi:DNA segregation ATPase FtsK/SpoIIIE-like protein
MLIARKVWDNQLDEVIKGIKLDVKAQVWPEKTQKAPIPQPPAAQANGGRGGANGQKGKGQKNPAGASAQRAHLNAEEAMQGIANALQSNETPDAARRSGDITGAEAQGNEVGPASRPDGAADAVAVDHAGADENTAAGMQADAPNAAPAPHRAQVVNQTPRATAKGAKTARPAADIKRSDALLEDAVELVTTQQAVSVRQIKTEFSVGTARAMKIIEELERDGVVSATDERGARKVLVAA